MSHMKTEFLSAVLVVSPAPERLFTFYRDVLGLPLEVEEHGGAEKHYGCELGDLHFAIHPTANFPDGGAGVGAVRLAFNTFDIQALAKQIEAAGHRLEYAPKDVGFAWMTALRDPDGNFVEFTQLGDKWFQHLEKRRAGGHDLVARWRNR